MTREIVTSIPITKYTTTVAFRTKNLVHFYRAVALFSMPVRSSELGLRRRK